MYNKSSTLRKRGLDFSCAFHLGNSTFLQRNETAIHISGEWKLELALHTITVCIIIGFSLARAFQERVALSECFIGGDNSGEFISGTWSS